ncbi:MAG: hypothetical protein L3J41_07035 [Melioribacteraceae bacterium]|nr:hypothetical protein [Melioribacteraceae bacterium]
MTKSITIYSFLLLLLLSFTTTFANKPNESEYSRIEKNLLKGISSENRGLKLSSAYFLGEIKSERAIIPLMNILHSAKDKAARQIAALSLYKINSARGIFAIKQAITFDDDKQTRRLCEIFYKEHLLRERSGEIEVEPIFASKLNFVYGEYKLSDFVMQNP